MPTKGVLLASGGLDSTVLAYELKRKDKLDSLFFVNYGQASAPAQLTVLRHHAGILGVPLHEEAVALPEYMRGTGAILGVRKPTPGEVHDSVVIKMPDKVYEEWRKTVFDYMEGRNTLFLTYATAYAVWRDVKTLFVGFQCNREEWADCLRTRSFGRRGWDVSPDFVGTWNDIAWHGFSTSVELVAPFLDRQLAKTDIVKLGRKLGVDMTQSYSCEFFPMCGECIACHRRSAAVGS